MTKRCSRCKLEYPVESFGRDRQRKDGIRVYCRPCHKASCGPSAERWRRTFPEKLRASRAKFRAANIDRVRKYDADHKRARYQRDKEKLAARQRAWQLANPAKLSAISARRRAAKRSASGYASAEQVVARVAMFGGKCWMCCKPATALDHVKPLSRGGSNWPANLRPICRSCNSSKKDRWPIVLGVAS